MDAKYGNPPPYSPEAPPAAEYYQQAPKPGMPPPAYAQPPMAYAQPAYPPPPMQYAGQAATTVNVTPVPTTQVIVVGGCPSCRVGVLEEDYTCCGICLAICFFPLGILCCLAMKQRRCPNCGAIFG